jgi:hypothetical protein
MTTPLITIAVQCHNFQRRFCWMLSSLAQQTRPDLVAVDVAHVPGNGRPTTEETCELFQSRLQIRRSEWTDFERFQLRGLVRNQQLQECRTDWLLFGDCDMVYHPEYFEHLALELKGKHPEARYMLSSGRTSQHDWTVTNQLVDREVTDRPREVERAYALADRLPKRRMGNVGAGFCQLVNVRHCPHGGYYVRPDGNRDWGWDRGSNPRSDVQFRKRVTAAGGPRVGLPRWFAKTAIHLNHHRDPEAGRHLTEQR